jgi:transposase
VTLTKEERADLEALRSSGKRAANTVLNALILPNCDKGGHQDAAMGNQQISEVLRVGMRRIDRVKRRFVEEGLERALEKRGGGPRPQARKIDGEVEARLVAPACSQAPGGRARWTLRLLADKLVELGHCEAVSHETVRRVLKKRNQTLAEAAMGHRARQKRRVRRAHGAGA